MQSVGLLAFRRKRQLYVLPLPYHRVLIESLSIVDIIPVSNYSHYEYLSIATQPLHFSVCVTAQSLQLFQLHGRIALHLGFRYRHCRGVRPVGKFGL